MTTSLLLTFLPALTIWRPAAVFSVFSLINPHVGIAPAAATVPRC